MSKRNALSKLASRIPSLITSKQSQEDRARVERALVDFPFFCKTYLKEYFYCDAAEYQKILYDVAQTRCITPEQMEMLQEFIPDEFQGTLKPMDEIEGVVDVEPRGHGKSTRWTFAYPLWMALKAMARFILITSSDAPSARGQMAAIKYELDNNELIIQDFGIQHVKGKKWNANTIELANGVMISAYGKGSSMRGVKNGAHRPDYVIVDDAFKDAESDSETMRKKVINWFNKTVLPIGQPKTFFIMINTITHNEDLASITLSKIAEGTMGRWVGLRFSAEVKEGQPLWPERYSLLESD